LTPIFFLRKEPNNGRSKNEATLENGQMVCEPLEL